VDHARPFGGGRLTPPARAARCAQGQRKIHEALDMMGPLEREIIGLQHF
jgi:hypothetical protein